MKEIKQHAEDFVLICEHIRRRVAHDIDPEAVRGSRRQKINDVPYHGGDFERLPLAATIRIAYQGDVAQCAHLGNKRMAGVGRLGAVGAGHARKCIQMKPDACEHIANVVGLMGGRRRDRRLAVGNKRQTGQSTLHARRARTWFVRRVWR